MKKKLLSMVLSLCMFLALMPMAAFADDRYEVTVVDTAGGSGSKVQSGETVQTSFAVGETVTVVPGTPDTGYELGSVSVKETASPNTAVTVTNNTFAMPAYAVTVNVSYQKTLPTAAEYAADAASGTDYVLDAGANTLTINTAKGAAWWSANGESYLGYTVQLTNNIDLAGFTWSPVGNPDQFSGTFDGNGYQLTGLTINVASQYAGLFGIVSTEGTVKNLCVASDSIVCTDEGSTGDRSHTGGIVGYNYGHVLNCANYATVECNATTYLYVYAGGIAGYSQGTIENCYNAGKIAASTSASGGRACAGGIAGSSNGGKVINSYNAGAVSAAGVTNYAGGVVGRTLTEAIVTACYSYAAVPTIVADSSANGTGMSNCGTFDTAGNLTLSGDGTLQGSTLLSALKAWVKTKNDVTYYGWKADSAMTPVNNGYPLLEKPHIHCACGGSINSGDHASHSDVAYTPWDGTEAITYTNSVASIYLTEDVTLTNQIEVGAGNTLNLCLNGHTITTAPEDPSSEVIDISDTSTVNLCDCQNSGSITGGQVQNSGTLNLYGGSIANNTVNRVGTVANYGTFAMYGGSIAKNSTDGFCGGVYNGGAFTMYGGEITGNASNESTGCGGVYNYGTFTMTGGSITDNTASIGAGVMNIGSFTMTGGSITGNHATLTGGGVASTNWSEDIKLSGKIEISGNTAGTANNDLALINAMNIGSYYSAKSFDETTTSLTVEIPAALQNTVPIGISILDMEMDEETGTLIFTPKGGVFTSGGDNSAYAGNFTSDRSEYQVVAEGAQLKLVPYLKNGADQSFTGGSDSDLIVTSSANLSDLVRVELGLVGGTVRTLTQDTDYTVASGSTIVTLKNSCLKTLAAGTYTVNIVSTTGTVSTTFTVVAAAGTPKPVTVSDNTLNAWVTAGGSITPGGISTVKDGANVTYTITPNAGYKITDVKVDGVSVGAVSSYTFSNIYGNHEIGAYFDKAGATATKTSVTVPATGDTENLMLYAVLAVVSLLGLGTVVVMARKKRRNG